MPIKIVESIDYHLWTDALHARQLARQTRNNWDRGTYVRWAVQTAWTAFEAVASDVLNASGLGNRFRVKFDEAVAAMGLPAVDWGQGLWQKVLKVYATRKEFVHVQPTIDQQKLMPGVEVADNAISDLRKAIEAVCDLVGQPKPIWVSDDDGSGFDLKMKSYADVTVTRAGVKEDDPHVVKIAYVREGREFISDILPPGTDHQSSFDRLLKNLNVPVSALRAYRGSTLIEETKVNARGA